MNASSVWVVLWKRKWFGVSLTSVLTFWVPLEVPVSPLQGFVTENEKGKVLSKRCTVAPAWVAPTSTTMSAVSAAEAIARRTRRAMVPASDGGADVSPQPLDPATSARPEFSPPQGSLFFPWLGDS
jgi:hypothetical protein